MTREEKGAIIDEVKTLLEEYPFFYVTDASAMTVEQINKLRRVCFEKGVLVKAIKNSFAATAMKDADASKGYAGLFDSFHGSSTFLFTKTAKVPAEIIEDYRKATNGEKPILKAAYIDTAVFVGDDQLKTLKELKSKEQLLGEVIGLLQSPARNVISALQSGGQKIAGLVKTLEERQAQ